ncbi:MAG: hypothetical protein AAGD11_09400 [Planctomycetota bacterium]
MHFGERLVELLSNDYEHKPYRQSWRIIYLYFWMVVDLMYGKAKLLLFGFSALLVFSGCGKQPVRYPVAGKVVIDGEPVTKGSIQFVPDAGRPFASKIASDGSFRLVEASLNQDAGAQGLAPGTYRVGVSSSEVINEDEGEVLKHIPARYADYRSSNIEIEIQAPNEDMLIELTWEGSKESEEEQAVENEEMAEAADQPKVEVVSPDAEQAVAQPQEVPDQE